MNLYFGFNKGRITINNLSKDIFQDDNIVFKVKKGDTITIGNDGFISFFNVYSGSCYPTPISNEEAKKIYG